MLFLNQRNLFLFEIKKYLIKTTGYFLDCTYGLGNISLILFDHISRLDKLFIYEQNNYFASVCNLIKYKNVFLYNTTNISLINLKLEKPLSFSIVDIGYCDSELINKRTLLNFLSYCSNNSVIEALNFFGLSNLLDSITSLKNSYLKFKVINLILKIRSSPVLYNFTFSLNLSRNFFFLRKFIDILSIYSSSNIIFINSLLNLLFLFSTTNSYIIVICFNSQEVAIVDNFYNSMPFNFYYCRTYIKFFPNNFTFVSMKVLKKK